MKNRTVTAWALAACAWITWAGCSPQASREETGGTPIVSEAPAPDPSQTGVISGAVFLDGAVPEPEELPIRGNPECSAFHSESGVLSEELVARDGRLQNALVYVRSGLEGRSFDPPARPVTVENRQCVYVPHVAAAQTGQPVVFLNSDPTLHNIHSYSDQNRPFNIGLPFPGMKQTRRFDRREVAVALKCDVHPWMTGYLAVLDHPFFAVTGPDGAFRLEGLPQGTYVIESWHEKLGTRSQTVEIGPRAHSTIEFRYTA